MVKKLAVMGTKGGCGKTTISHFILPYFFSKYYQTKNIVVAEFESVNLSRENKYKNSCITYLYDDLTDIEKTKHFFENLDENNYYIFDVGRHKDLDKIIENLSKNSVNDMVFVFPFELNNASFYEAEITYKRVLKKYGEIKTVFVINRMTFRYDDGGKPYKEFLNNEDILLSLKKADIDMMDILKDENVHLSYIPEMPELLPNVLYSMDGCCLDICSEYLQGQSGSIQRKNLKKSIKNKKTSRDKQKELYVDGIRDINRRGELFKMLHYCKVFYSAINRFN